MLSGLPRTSRANVCNRHGTDAETKREYPRGLSGSADQGHIGWREFGHAVTFILGVVASALDVAIAEIVGLCSKEQVARVHAGRVVATMKHLHAFWDWPVGEHPRDVSRLGHSTLKRETTVEASGSCPTPTFVGSPHYDHRPEARYAFVTCQSSCWHERILSREV